MEMEKISARKRSLDIIREQFRLFASNNDCAPDPKLFFRLSKRERLLSLLEGELNFHGENSGYASHDFHAFAAKFPPQLPRSFIRGLTNPGDTVLDPMMGSGTTVVEAMLEGRRGIGIDLDPLAIRLGRVKTTAMDLKNLRATGYWVIEKANRLLAAGKAVEERLAENFDQSTKVFIDYWFLPITQRELTALLLAIEEVSDRMTRHSLELVFSSIIITKSGGVSMARDLAHSRPHLDKTKVPKNAIEQFMIRLRKNLNSFPKESNDQKTFVISGDARVIPINNESVDLIVTSPPYANAIDYMRAHKFSLVWLGQTIKRLSEIRAEYIGSEKRGEEQWEPLPQTVQTILKQLSSRDSQKAFILKKYFIEMKTALSEMFRILRKDTAAIVVVGPSVMRDLNVQTHTCLAEIASQVNFDVVGVVQRKLDRNKRMMPARFGKKSDSTIEQRIHEEYVIGLLKP